MISDESNKFPELSNISKHLKYNLQANGLILNTIVSNLQSQLKTDPSLERSNMFHHFFIYNIEQNQIIQSSGNNFGYNSEKDYVKYLYTYG